jgi:hypothetical protein
MSTDATETNSRRCRRKFLKLSRAAMRCRKGCLEMRIGRRLLFATALLGVIAGSALFVGYTAAPAAAQTAADKSTGYQACRNLGASVQTCCHNNGGAYEAIYDENGNLIAETCTFHSDPLVTSQGTGLSPAAANYGNPPTGTNASGANSGGHSNVGLGQTVVIVTPVSIIP